MGKKKRPNQQNRPAGDADPKDDSKQPTSRPAQRTDEDQRPVRGAEGGIQPPGPQSAQGQSMRKGQQFSDQSHTEDFPREAQHSFGKQGKQYQQSRPESGMQRGAQQQSFPERQDPQLQQSRPEFGMQRGAQQQYFPDRQGPQQQQQSGMQRGAQQQSFPERQGPQQQQQTRPESGMQRGAQQQYFPDRQGPQQQQQTRPEPPGMQRGAQQQSFPDRQGPQQQQQTRPESGMQRGAQQQYFPERQGPQQHQQTRPESGMQRGPQQQSFPDRQGPQQQQQTRPEPGMQRGAQQQYFPERQGPQQQQQTRPESGMQRGAQQQSFAERQGPQQQQQSRPESGIQRGAQKPMFTERSDPNIQTAPQVIPGKGAWGTKEPILEIPVDVSDVSIHTENITPAQLPIEQDLEKLEIGDSKSKLVSTPVKESPKRSNGKAKYLKLNVNFEVTPSQYQKFLPPRPDDGGKKGRSIQLIINCLDMKIKPMKIFMYDIELTKAEVMGADKKMRDVLLKVKKKDVLRNVVSEFLKGKDGVPVFDGGRIIFNNKLLPFPEGVSKPTFNYKLDSDTVTCYFTIQHVREEDIELESLTHYVQSKGRSDNMPQEALRALDTIIREMFLNKNLLNIGRNAIFDPKTSTPLRCGPYVLIEGYSTTVRPHMWNIRFNFDKTQVVCHEPINLLQYINKMMNIDRGFNSNLLGRKLKTLRVQSTHLKNAEGKSYIRKYTIFGFSKLNAKETKITEKNMSIEQYFQKEYGIRLNRPDLPMVKVNPNKDTFIPIELLTVLPHQKVLDNDGKIVQEVIKFAAIPCFQRLDILRKAVSNLGLNNRADKFLQNYMIDISPNLIGITARVLDGPEAIFGNSKKEFLRAGKWDFRGKRFLNPYPNQVHWALFAVGVERDYQRNEKPLYDVEEQLGGAAGRVGINMANSYNFCYVVNTKIDMVATDIIERSKHEKKKLDLLVFIVNNDDDYRAVKRFGDMTYGIATQCMKYANLSKQRALDQYLGNIMLKINGKLGGTNWELSTIRNSGFTPIKQPFMVFGIDVTHPASNKNDLMKSIAAMVGSLDNNASIYRAIIRQQIAKQEKSIIEVIIEMEDMVYQLLLSFYQANRKLKPRHLIFYRDGVSEGQFDIVFRHEINAIQNACQKLEVNYQPPITYIVVQKRHKIRFFPSNDKDAVGRSGNVPAGTIVDKDITHCREFDFYLCSHEGIQGTSKPAHYHVLFDENNWGSDDLQNFTYYLCHMYARCTRSVSYPAPTYYAHLAAFRGRTLIGQSDDDSASRSSGHSGITDLSDSKILINEFHNNRLFFI